MFQSSTILFGAKHIWRIARPKRKVWVWTGILRRQRILTDAAAVLLDQQTWKHTEAVLHDRIETNRMTVLCYVEMVSYDGFELKVATQSGSSTYFPAAAANAAPSGAAGSSDPYEGTVVISVDANIRGHQASQWRVGC